MYLLIFRNVQSMGTEADLIFADETTIKNCYELLWANFIEIIAKEHTHIRSSTVL